MTAVINDPHGHPTVPAGSDCRLILKFWDERTDTLSENSDHYRPGLWSASWINKTSKETDTDIKKSWESLQQLQQ